MENDPAADLPSAPGAYALVVDAARPMAIVLGGRIRWDLDEGLYLYAGSAWGPGGPRARIRRHLTAAKTVRWHIDRLTNAFGVAMAIALPSGRECGVASAAAALPGATVPAPGFGSADCRACRSHLIRLPDDIGRDHLGSETFLRGLAQASGAEGAVVWRAPPVMCYWRPPA